MYRFALFILPFLTVMVACDSRGPGPGGGGNSPGGGGNPGPGSTSPSQPAGKPDLQIISASVSKRPQGGMTHELAVTVVNNGNALASGFNGGGTYTCPGGTITSAGVSIVQGGYLLAGKQMVYKMPFRYQCQGSPALVTMNLTIDDGNAVAESNESNNTYSFQADMR